MASGTIILLKGKARSGKDSTADVLEKAWGFRRYSFAATLKEVAQRILMRHYGLDAETARYHLWEDKESPIPRAAEGLSGRKELQLLGDDLREVLADDVFVQALLRRIRDVDRPERAVITDMRSLVEMGAVSALRGYGYRVLVWKVERGVTSGLDARAQAHRTELEGDAIPHDLALDNNGTLDELRDKVTRLCEDLSL